MPANSISAQEKTRIAILSDAPGQADLICRLLAAAGHVCHAFGRDKELLLHVRREACDMYILDWQTGDAGAPEVLAWIRENPVPPPVLCIASPDREDDIVAAIEAGANDCLLKPIRRNELVARVNARLRIAYPARHAAELLQFGAYAFETRARRLLFGGKRIELAQKEFDLALLLFRNAGRPLSRAYLHEAVWGGDGEMVSRTVDTHVSRVRNKLALLPENGFRLATVYGYGYLLEQMPV